MGNGIGFDGERLLGTQPAYLSLSHLTAILASSRAVVPMRTKYVLPLLPLVVSFLLPGQDRADARPEFARKEQKACGYCHVNPRGGGARNRMGLLYARNEFSFPQKSGDLRDFTRRRDRDAMVRVQKMIAVQHIPAAIGALTKLARGVKGDPAKKAVADQIHGLDVKGYEILGEARRLLRKNDAEKIEEGVELLVVLNEDYKGLSVHDDAADDLRDILKDKERKTLVRKERKEQKARRILLDAMLLEAEGKPEKAVPLYRRVAESHAGTRAAKQAKKKLVKRAG